MKNSFELSYIPTEKQLADFLTKAIPRESFNTLTKESNIMQISHISERGGVLVELLRHMTRPAPVVSTRTARTGLHDAIGTRWRRAPLTPDV